MTMTAGARTAHHGPVRLAFETVGPARGEPLLLIMGLDSPMRWWPDGFCFELADRGFTVARYDHRDTGRSTRVPGSPGGGGAGRSEAAYSASDMVADLLAVLDALDWPAAHLVGHSLGASVALATALRRPDRVRSVVAISGLPRGYALGEAVRYVRPLGLARMLRVAAGRPRTAPGDVRRQVALARLQASPAHPFDERWARETARQVAADGPADPGTALRQLTAIRTGARVLRHPERIRVPLLAIHGADDPLLRPSAAAALARAVPGGRAVVFAGMGHELPRTLWPALAEEIARTAQRAAPDGTPGQTSRAAPRATSKPSVTPRLLVR
jgi:pimeloyl-ACP methyl ester carboxylesterase